MGYESLSRRSWRWPCIAWSQADGWSHTDSPSEIRPSLCRTVNTRYIRKNYEISIETLRNTTTIGIGLAHDTFCIKAKDEQQGSLISLHYQLFNQFWSSCVLILLLQHNIHFLTFSNTSFEPIIQCLAPFALPLMSTSPRLTVNFTLLRAITLIASPAPTNVFLWSVVVSQAWRSVLFHSRNIWISRWIIIN